MRIITFLCAFIAAVSDAADTRPLVVTSFLPIYCWAVNVAGEHARVENLLPARAEPHEYAFTPSDARKLNNAKLVLVNGLGLEQWLAKWTSSAPNGEQKVVVVSDSVMAATRGAGENPHFWLCPQLACISVSNIAVALSRTDPANARAYHSNAVAYVERLRRLDVSVREDLSPIKNRAMVTYHNAFPYFAACYGFEIAGVVEQVPEVNPTPKYLTQLGRTIRERNVPAIFIAPNSASRLARQIAKDFRVQLVELDTLETGALTPDAYETAMRANAAALRKALQ